MNMEDFKEFIEWLNSIPEGSLGHEFVVFITIFGTFFLMMGLAIFLMKKFPDELNGTSSAATNDQKEPIGE